MPKKTKKQKILASYRRKLQLLEKLNQSNSFIQEKPQEKKFSEKRLSENIYQKVKIEKKEDKNISYYFFSDLKKSLIFIFLIISLEIALYFVKLIK